MIWINAHQFDDRSIDDQFARIFKVNRDFVANNRLHTSKTQFGSFGVGYETSL